MVVGRHMYSRRRIQTTNIALVARTTNVSVRKIVSSKGKVDIELMEVDVFPFQALV